MPLLLYPVFLLKFWYIDATKLYIHFCREVLSYCISLFSIPSLLHTFFRPVKNEYRKDLIIFSIMFGMAVKSALIVLSVLIMCLILGVGVVFLIGFWVFPYFLYQLLSL
ncbi:MAG TPA: hypothetical protein PLD54_01105 [Candidatus Levybacteria bacterium]|nr:hypothetical protein [Candidatus Levybacteria bacterium]